MIDLELVIGTSTKTSYLVPESIRLSDSLDSRSALSFSLNMPATATRPAVGAPVFLSVGTSEVYVTPPNLHNLGMDGNALTVSTNDWVGQSATNYWYARFNITTEAAAVWISAGALKFQSFATNQTILANQAYYGNFSSLAIPVQMGETYRFSITYRNYLVTSSDGYFNARIFAGSAASTLEGTMPTSDDPLYLYGGSFGNSSGTVFYDWLNTSDNFMELRFYQYLETGTVEIEDVTIKQVTLPRIFGGTLEDYSETSFPMTSYVKLDCNAVDFTQMLGKRIVYNNYPSSGLGEYKTEASSETFFGDGLTRTWKLNYPVYTTPTVEINSVTADVAPTTASSTHGYYYTLSSHIILANTSNNAPTSSDTLTVEYTAIVGLPAWDSDIISNINDGFFKGEVIDCETKVSTGVRIREVDFNFVPGNEAINSIAGMANRAWYIDPWRRMHYFARDENAAPFEITSTSNNYISLTKRRSRDKYRNRQYVLNSYGGVPTSESFYGDGQTRTFTLAYPVMSQPVVKVDGFVADVGLMGSASTHGYYWAKESPIIMSNATNAVLASTDILTITYTGLQPVVAIAEDGDEIAARAAIEYNSGIYEEISVANKMYEDDSAIDYGASVISQYGKQLDTITFETYEDGLAAGQLIHIDVDNNELDDYYLITDIHAQDVKMEKMRYQVTCVSGLDRGGWVSFYRNLISGTKSVYSEPYINIRQIDLRTGSGTIEIADALDQLDASYSPCLVGTGVIGTCCVV